MVKVNQISRNRHRWLLVRLLAVLAAAAAITIGWEIFTRGKHTSADEMRIIVIQTEKYGR